MAKTIQEVMTVDPTSYPAGPTVADAARAMRGMGVGDVLVEQDGALSGLSPTATSW